MDDYLSKPFTLDQLRAVLERWLSPAAAGEARPSASTTSWSSTTRPGVASDPGATGHAPLDVATVDGLRALQRPGQPDVLGRVMRAYLSSAPGLLKALRIAVTQGDAAAAHQAAHGLKSSSANIGALHLASLCRELESAARAGTLDGAGQMVPAIEAEYEVVRAAATSLVPEPMDVAP
jgi:HPt (histidine-containing phosphotransfer) domain-containing protein